MSEICGIEHFLSNPGLKDLLPIDSVAAMLWPSLLIQGLIGQREWLKGPYPFLYVKLPDLNARL